MIVNKICENHTKQNYFVKYNTNPIRTINNPFSAFNNISNIDRITFTGKIPNPSQIGKYIKNVGLIISEPKVLNSKTNKLENCYLIYQNSDLDGVIRLVKKDPIKIKELSSLLSINPQIMDILERHNFYTIDGVLDKIAPLNQKVVDLFNDLRISEVGYTTITKNRGKQIILDKGYKCRPNSDIIFVEDLLVKQKEYAKASKLVYLPLLEAFEKNGDKDILTVALAIGENSASPVNLYLRMGFKPLKGTIQEIESHKINTNKGDRIDPKYKVTLYLPEDAPLYEIIKNNSTLNEINKINPNWFKRLKDES